MSLLELMDNDVLILKKDGQHKIEAKANIQSRVSFFDANADIEVGDIVKVLVSGEEREVAEVNFIYDRAGAVHHKEVKLVSIRKEKPAWENNRP